MRLRTLALVTVLLSTALGGVSAGAQAAPAGGLGFGIRALGPAAKRGYFFFRDVRPGSTLVAKVRVGNVTGRAQEVVLKAQDATTSGTGGLSFTPVEDGPGLWLAPRIRRVTVAPHASVDVGVRVSVPADARPGDHVAGVVAYSAAALRRLKQGSSARSAVSLKFISRLAIPIRVRVPGRLLARVELRDVRLRITPSGSAVDVVFANTGNVLIPSSEGQVTVGDGSVALASRRIALTSFAPGSEIHFLVPFRGAPAEGAYRVRGFLQPMFAPLVEFDRTLRVGRAESRELERKTGTPAIAARGGGGSGLPGWAWGVGGLLAALVIALAAALARTRRVASASE